MMMMMTTLTYKECTGKNDLQKPFNHDEHLTLHHHPREHPLICEMNFFTQDCT